jgi:hypothetical protein
MYKHIELVHMYFILFSLLCPGLESNQEAPEYKHRQS